VGLVSESDTEAALERVRARREREAAALASVQCILNDGPLEIGTLVNRIRDCPVARGLFRPSSRTLVGFLERNRSFFWVRNDPVHTTVVGVRTDSDDVCTEHHEHV
jgi:hypothetical protein